ncbi:hypothetical protein MMC20_006316 [Loxospora ochrophaea]|nr:hypothetical protein [Loxospora ochrophaea]
MAKCLSETASKEIREAIDNVTADPNVIPGCVMVVVGKDGAPIFTHASGTRGIDSKAPMTLDTTFHIASCTKMITGLAAMQLCEQGTLALDDSDLVEKLCPELKAVKILKDIDAYGNLDLVEKKNRITLRMLLSHTAGFGYTYFDHTLRKWGQPVGTEELSGYARDVLESPLRFEPGTKWQYGVGIDWAGQMIERVSRMSLNDYFEKHIFQPLGIKNISFLPHEGMKQQLATMHLKMPDGKLLENDHILRPPLKVNEKPLPPMFIHSGGGGCFARPLEYCEIIATLLNDGLSPTTGNRILKTETVQEMFRNQIPDMPNFGREPIPAARPLSTNPIPQLYPQPPEQPQGWGLTFMLTTHPGATGRGSNTAHWAGLPNLYWWCDREQGIGGMIATQILPYADPQVIGLWAKVEQAVYANCMTKSEKGRL